MLNHALLVDDSKSARFALRKLLERNGLRVDIAENAEQALGYLNDNRPDVIFMDHFMPGMDGFEAVKILKTQPNTATIPVVMCTSKDGDAYMAEAHAAGAVDILSKPATSGSLGEVLDKLCQAANEEPVIDLSLDTAVNMMPDELFEQVIDTSVILPQQGVYESANRPESKLYEPTLEIPAARPVMPILEDVVVPVEEIKRVAAESAREVAEEEIDNRVAKLLAEKVPEMREMVMANFDSVVRSMLKGYIDEAMNKAKENFSGIVRDESRQVADEISREVVETAVKAQVHSLEETLHREMNEHLAEVYTNIGDLKANQHLKTASPELQQQLEMQSREAAEEVSREALIEASDLASKTAQDVAKEVTSEANQRMQSELSEKLKSTVEHTKQTARTEASEIVWQKIEESQKVLLGKISGAKSVAVVALLVAAGAIVASFLL
ncbi:MAG: response regulator [Pseudomonadales bacterium]